jgi:hypothetical protein
MERKKIGIASTACENASVSRDFDVTREGGLINENGQLRRGRV